MFLGSLARLYLADPGTAGMVGGKMLSPGLREDSSLELRCGGGIDGAVRAGSKPWSRVNMSKHIFIRS